MCNLNDMGYPKHESPKRRMRRPSEKGIYDSTKGQLVDQCWGLGLGQPSLSVTEAVPLWSWDHKLAMPSMARLGTLRPEEAKERLAISY